MDLNRLLMWMVYVSCSSLLIASIRWGRTAKGWVLVAGTLLGLTVVLQQLLPNLVGLLSGAIWAVVVLVPQWGSIRINQLTWQHRFKAARQWAQVLRILHPMDSFWTWPQYLYGMELAQSGQLSEAVTMLQPFSESASLMGLVARCQIFRYQGQWQELLKWMTMQLPKETVMRSGSLMTTYLMALGETHQLNDMILELERFQPKLANTTSKEYWDLSRLVVFAFCGQPEMVARLLKGPLAKLSDHGQQFWSSTAATAAGEEKGVQANINKLIESSDCLYADTLLKRTPRIRVDGSLSDHSHYLLKAWGDNLFIELQDRARQQSRIWQSPITLGLIAINLVVFVAEIARGGSTDPATLYTLGALIPQEVVAGEWWRLLAAAFLHFGPLHLGLNMFGLGLLGPFVERMLGPGQFLMSYLLTAIGSMLTLTILTVKTIDVTPVAVGASGAIMGLIGIEAAIQIRILWHQSSNSAAARLRLIGLFVPIQMVFDVMTPEVSFMGHASGLIIGFGVGWLLRLKHLKSMPGSPSLQSSQA